MKKAISKNTVHNRKNNICFAFICFFDIVKISAEVFITMEILATLKKLIADAGLKAYPASIDPVLGLWIDRETFQG